MKSQHHIRLLDSFGEDEFWSLKDRYQTTFDAYRSLRKRVLEKQKMSKNTRRGLRCWNTKLLKSKQRDLKSGEDIQLNQERDKLLNHKQIADTLTNAYALLDNEDFSSLNNLRSAMSDLQSLEEFDPDYKQLSSSLTEAYYVVEDVTKRLSDVVDNLDFDGNRLLQLESRLDLLNTITKKYGGTVDDVLDYFSKISEEYNLLTGNDLSGDDLEVQLKNLEKELVERAGQLSQSRHELAVVLEDIIRQELQDLYMEKARFQVRFTKGKFNREGNETVEFYISTNPGEDFKPLVKVASGGELSRLMLAIKSAFARKEGKTSIVFDEVDTGVSGRVARQLPRKFTKSDNMDKYWRFPIYHKSLLLQIISSLLRKYPTNIRPFLVSVS